MQLGARVRSVKESENTSQWQRDPKNTTPQWSRRPKRDPKNKSKKKSNTFLDRILAFDSTEESCSLIRVCHCEVFSDSLTDRTLTRTFINSSVGSGWLKTFGAVRTTTPKGRSNPGQRQVASAPGPGHTPGARPPLCPGFGTHPGQGDPRGGPGWGAHPGHRRSF